MAIQCFVNSYKLHTNLHPSLKHKMRLNITFNDFFGIKKPERWKGEFTILLLSNLIPT